MDEKIIRRSDGEPFANKKAAIIQQTIQEKQGITTKLVEVEEEKFVLEVVGERRPKRQPLGSRSVWNPKKDPNYEYRGVNDNPDKPGRIEMFQRAGWEIVKSDEAPSDEYAGRSQKPGSAVAIPGGGKITMVLMRKRKDWYEKDMEEKQKVIDKSERLLKQHAQVDHLHAASGYTEGIDIKDQG